MPLWRRRRSVADGFSLPASAQGDTFSARLSEMQATTSQTRPTLTQVQPEIHVVCFLTRYRSAWAEYNLFPIKSIQCMTKVASAIQHYLCSTTSTLCAAGDWNGGMMLAG